MTGKFPSLADEDFGPDREEGEESVAYWRKCGLVGSCNRPKIGLTVESWRQAERVKNVEMRGMERGMETQPDAVPQGTGGPKGVRHYIDISHWPVANSCNAKPFPDLEESRIVCNLQEPLLELRQWHSDFWLPKPSANDTVLANSSQRESISLTVVECRLWL